MGIQIKDGISNLMSQNQITSIPIVYQRTGLLNNAHFNSKAFIWINWAMNLLINALPLCISTVVP